MKFNKISLILTLCFSTISLASCSLEPVKGDKGDKGDQGQKGDKGEKGEQGDSPIITIGPNGNWFINGVDSGKPSRGEKGETGEKGDTGEQGQKGDKGSKGDTGAKGDQGEPGQKGDAGVSPIITVGPNGNWWINGVDTGKAAQGEKGDTGAKGDQGEKGDQGIQGEKGDTGATGQDGLTPTLTIGPNGNWFINGQDSGTSARGDKGDTGAQGETGQKGDTGPQGEKGDTGAAGQDAKDPKVVIGSNGNWWINGKDTGIRAQGPKGDQGEKGDQGQVGPQGPAGQNGDNVYIETFEFIRKVDDGHYLYKVTFTDGTTQEITIPVPNHKEKCLVYYLVNQEVKQTRIVNYGEVAPDVFHYTNDAYRIFDGWYNGNVKWDFNTSIVYDDVYLEAKFTDREKPIFVNQLNIANKAFLSEPWHLRDFDKTVSITTSPQINVLQFMQEGKLTITSSDPTIIGCNGVTITPLKEGKATITVTCGHISDSIEITVLPRDVVACNSVKDLISKVFNNGVFQPVDKIHTLTAAFVCQEPRGNSVITDGTDFFQCYSMKGAENLKFGDNVIVEGKIYQYFSAIQFKAGEYIKAETNNIKVPEPITFNEAKLTEIKNIALSNTNALDPDNFYQSLLGKVTLQYNGNCQGTIGSHLVDLRKCSTELNNLMSTFEIGDIIEVTGAINGWNDGYKYFNMIPTSIVITKKAIHPTSISLALGSQKLFDPIDLSSYITMEPAGAEAEITYEIVDNSHILEQRNNMILATSAGSVRITPIANGTLRGQPVDVTFTSERAQNLITNATPKTITELLTLDPTISHKDALYIVEGKLTEIVNGTNVYGDSILVGTDGSTMSAYGIGNSYLDFHFAPDGTIDYFKNPKVFEQMLDKDFKIGDTIQLLVFADSHKGKASYKCVYLGTTQIA